MSEIKNIPDGWEETTLGQNLTEIAMGPFGSDLKVDMFTETGVPIIKGGNLLGSFVSGKFSFVSEEKATSLRKAIAYPNDLIITHRGTLGQVSLVPKNKYKKYITSQSQLRLSVNPNKIYYRYLLYFFKSRIGQYELLKNSSQVGVPAISTPTKSIKEIDLIIPSNVKEQKSIASILTSFDDKIELLNNQNKTLEEIAQTILIEWIEKKSADWEFVKIINLLEITSSKRIFYNEYVTTGVPFYRSKEIIELSKKTNVSTELFITESRFKQIKDNFDVPKKGDILLSAVGTIGVPFQVRNHNNFYFKDGNLVWFKNFNKDLSSDYVYTWLKLKSTQDILKMISIGSTQKALTISSLKELDIPFIKDSKKREEFYKFLKSNLDKINHNQFQIETLAQTRDELLPKLMSGEIRVNNI